MVDPDEAARNLRELIAQCYFGAVTGPLITDILDDRDRLLAAAAAAPASPAYDVSVARLDRWCADLSARLVELAARLDRVEGDYSTRNAVAEMNGWRDVVAPMIVRLDDMHRTPPTPGEVAP